MVTSEAETSHAQWKVDPFGQVWGHLKLENGCYSGDHACVKFPGGLVCVVSLRPWLERESGRRRAKVKWLWNDAK